MGHTGLQDLTIIKIIIIMATTCRVFKGGPLELTGEFQITGTDGKKIDTGSPVYLCRCGGSGNKPFCDGTHNNNGFNG
jgi:hypothetical protein